MTNELATHVDDSAIEAVLIGGDLSKLTAPQRLQYYKRTCESLGLNPLTRPFDYITLNGKLTLYAKKDATDQLRSIHQVSIDDVEIRDVDDQFVVKVKGHDSTGRSDVELGVVRKTDMQGNLANAQMKAVTKAKRRLTLSLCGLGMLDETEVETIPGANPVSIADDGEIVDSPAVPLDNIPEMSLEMARSEKSSDGRTYGEIADSEPNKLGFMFAAIQKREPSDENKRKMTAIQTILKNQ